MRRFAEDTSVPVSRTRGEIDDLLREWGCTKLSWADEYDARRAALQFVWVREGKQYLARFALALPKREDFIAQWKKKHGSWSNPGDNAIEKALSQGERSSYRVLLLWLKAALNAVQAGIVSAEAVFLPWLVTADGTTVSDVLVPRMGEISTTPSDRLLPSGGR